MFTDIDLSEYQAQFTEDDHLLLDVREIDEYTDARIPWAVNLPLSELIARWPEIPQDKPIVVVCARGGRSAQAANYLGQQGLQNLYNLVDGTIGWVMAGLPTDEG